MSQKINLYQVEKRKSDTRLTFRQVTVSFAIYFILLVLMTTHHLYQYAILKIDFIKTQKLKTQKTSTLENILRDVEKQKVNDKIMKELEEKNSENKQKTRLLNILSASGEEKFIPYSGYFESIARQKTEGLWLKKIAIKENGSYLLLSGACLKPMAIMDFMNHLKKEKPFSERVFQLFNLSFDSVSNESIFSLESAQSEGGLGDKSAH